jgi:hypothetical protein
MTKTSKAVILLLVSTAHAAETVPAYASSIQQPLFSSTPLATQGKIAPGTLKNPVY